MASNAVEKVKDTGLIESIKSGASTVIDKSKDLGGSLAGKIRESNLGEKSLDALSSVGSYVSGGASAVYSKVTGSEKQSLYRDIDELPNDANEKLFNAEPNYAYGNQSKGNYQPPQGEFSWHKDEPALNNKPENRYFNNPPQNRNFGYPSNEPNRNVSHQREEANRNYNNPREEPNRTFNYQREETRNYGQPASRNQTYDEIPDFLTGDTKANKRD